MPAPTAGLPDLNLDRAGALPLAEQIHLSLRAAILEGRIAAGARLPSWRDLATQLGVARGTVRAAYDRLADEMLVATAGAAGTRVAAPAATVAAGAAEPAAIRRPLADMIHGFSKPPLAFQMGVPAQDGFPAKSWARARLRAVRADALGPTSYADPRGQPALREQLAAYLAMARGIACVPDQILVTGGFRGGLALALRALALPAGAEVWTEEPGFPLTRRALTLAGLEAVPVPVDGEGLDVACGIAKAPGAALAIVTPGQQAPLGVALSPARRRALLDWAAGAGAWVIEDDYLSELQLRGRPAPALFAGDRHGRVIHIGSFSKTLSPALGLGFTVLPLALAERFAEAAALLGPAPDIATQMAVAAFIADGHYLRHLRHMKRLYGERRRALVARLGLGGDETMMAGLAVLVRLAPDVDDVRLAAAAVARGLAPAPLSPWYVEQAGVRGLLLGVTNPAPRDLERAVRALLGLLAGG
ncbi:PLP-dependent aminotransferase family protein [Sphingomonas quercus]|uniref:PLP-dependent aminotransferase family protein n=1 Tax=Sphingomonas quercus TaxID=2842451 RepID=A0ABS6BIH0_9SPHN|nr:PLP-dependent aminotransferase family protein [Sphingomonas quercus]MBU3078103.1 PLP-dependent aminotransferase family protein [Sphingomonas quercus]